MDSAASFPKPYKIGKKILENPRTVSLVLEGSLACTPGQFAMLWLPGVDEKPFSISGADPLMFTVSHVGPFSEALQTMCGGDVLWVRGPFGRGFSFNEGRALLVGGGYGAAPLAFLARVLLTGQKGANAEAVLGARTSSDLLFAKRFRDLGMPVHTATEDGTEGTTGMVTDVVGPLLRAGHFSLVQACGPKAMLEALAGLCGSAGVPVELSFEAYMRCGIGLCGACEHSGRLVCMDGPVFSAEGVENVG